MAGPTSATSWLAAPERISPRAAARCSTASHMRFCGCLTRSWNKRAKASLRSISVMRFWNAQPTGEFISAAIWRRRRSRSSRTPPWSGGHSLDGSMWLIASVIRSSLCGQRR